MLCAIALGSNLGDRLAHLRRAASLILECLADARLIAAAPVYETAPVDCPDGSDAFYNTVIEIEADDEPLAVLDALRQIEAEMGRPNEHAHHAPRKIDLDILYADSLVMKHDRLTLPHPRMTQRRFVLEPLAVVRPQLVLPGQKDDVATLLALLSSAEPPLRIVAREWL